MLARLRVVASRAAQTARAMSTAASVPVEVWCRARAGGQLHAARDRAAATLPHPSLPTRPQVHNPGGALRVVVTKELPGDRWLAVLTAAGCRVEVCTAEQTILDNATIKRLIGDKCDGVIGQLTEVWDGGVGGGASVQWRAGRRRRERCRPASRGARGTCAVVVAVSDDRRAPQRLCPTTTTTHAHAELGRRAVWRAQGGGGARVQQLCGGVQQRSGPRGHQSGHPGGQHAG